MSWTPKGTNTWGSDSADGSVIHRGTRAWPSGANATGDIGFLALTYPGTGAPNAHADWGTPIIVSTDADTAGAGVRTTYLYVFVYAGTAPNLSWNPGVPYGAVLQTHRHSSEIDFTIGTAIVEKNADSTTHTLTGGVASLGTDSLILCIASNGRSQTYVNTSSTAPTGNSGSGEDTTTAPTTSQWIERAFGYSIGSPFSLVSLHDCVLNSGSTGSITTTLSASTKGTLAAIAIKPGVTSLLTVTNPVERTNFQGRTGSKNVTFSGTYTGPAETIQVQIEKASTGAVVVAWTNIAVSPTGGTWSGSVTIPSGGWYNAIFRKATTTSVTTQTTSRWGVGYTVGITGQSHVTGFGSSLRGTGTPDDRASEWGVGATAPSALSVNGAGRVKFANDLIALMDAPVTIIDYGVDGTLLSFWYSSGGGPTSDYNAWATRVTNSGQGLSSYMNWQGDANAQAATARATYLSEATSLFAYTQSTYGNNLSIQGILGRYLSGDNNSWDLIRRAHMDFVNADTVNNRGLNCLGVTTDSDHQHFDTAGYLILGSRLAQLHADYYSGGTVGSGNGPKIASATYNGATVRVRLTHDNGSDFTPTSSIGGFRISSNGSLATITSAVRDNGGTILFTTSAALVAPVTVDYAYGADPTTALLADNTTAGMPLYPSTDPFTATQSTGVCSESDTAFARTAVQIKAVGLASESDSSRTLTPASPIGLATESDTAVTRAAVQIKAIGLSVETDVGLGLGSGQLAPVGLATESDTAVARVAVQIKATGLSVEIDAGLNLGSGQSSPVGLATESDTAVTRVAVQIKAVELSAESDSSLALGSGQSGGIGIATESDSALACIAVQIKIVGLAVEFNSALGGTTSRVPAYTLSSTIRRPLATLSSTLH